MSVTSSHSLSDSISVCLFLSLSVSLYLCLSCLTCPFHFVSVVTGFCELGWGGAISEGFLLNSGVNKLRCLTWKTKYRCNSLRVSLYIPYDEISANFQLVPIFYKMFGNDFTPPKINGGVILDYFYFIRYKVLI